MVVVALKEHELPNIPGDRAAAERGCRCGGRPPSVTARSPHVPGPPGTTEETKANGRRPRSPRWIARSWVLGRFERRRSGWRSRSRPMLEDVREKARQSAQRSDAGDSAGRDVLDAPQHPTGRLRSRIEMEDESPLRGQLECHRARDPARPRFVAVAFAFHSADDTAGCASARRNGRQITVRRG